MVRVTTAAQAAAMDSRAMAAGAASWALMDAAGTAAAAIIADRFAGRLAAGVMVFVGTGNNGGDGWLVASRLAARGAPVTVVAAGEPATDDARRARSELPSTVPVIRANGTPATAAVGVAVDALIGTGATGAPRAPAAQLIGRLRDLRAQGSAIVALDVPSGVDASTGAAHDPHVIADLTVTFGSVKRGLLRNRGAAGAIVAVDIGLGAAGDDASAPSLLDAAAALAAVPAIPADANKGTRRRLLVIGGAEGMAGAAILAARGALRSGVGMVRLCVAAPSVAPVQAAEAAALTAHWPSDDAAWRAVLGWAHAVVLGPGLGLEAESRAIVDRVLTEWRGPVVVDADALTAFEGRAEALGSMLAGRPAVVTPHAVEAQRLAGVTAADLDAGRFESAARLAALVSATVLLKGVPTVVSDGVRTVVSASGTPVLATGGTGDVLAGIVGTLLAQGVPPVPAAATGAWVHGRAAEIAGAGVVRGVVLDDVVDALRLAWSPVRAPTTPVLAELPAVGPE